jgi:hypothetical protein
VHEESFKILWKELDEESFKILWKELDKILWKELDEESFKILWKELDKILWKEFDEVASDEDGVEPMASFGDLGSWMDSFSKSTRLEQEDLDNLNASVEEV